MQAYNRSPENLITLPQYCWHYHETANVSQDPYHKDLQIKHGIQLVKKPSNSLLLAIGEN